ncbi:MAG: 30S ribosomal protein S6 [Desulfamplus sp.]|nr:30S ribosomal protein S6 [Desulfamplus sp.]
MRRYETIFIADPDLQEEARKNLFKKFTNLLSQTGGLLIKIEDWGNRKLAYEIKKKSRGYYLCLTYGGDGDIVRELERNLRLDEKIMKFMTILLEKDIDEEALRQEIASGPEYKVTTPDSAEGDDDSSNGELDDEDMDDDDLDDEDEEDDDDDDDDDDEEDKE